MDKAKFIQKLNIIDFSVIALKNHNVSPSTFGLSLAFFGDDTIFEYIKGKLKTSRIEKNPKKEDMSNFAYGIVDFENTKIEDLCDFLSLCNKNGAVNVVINRDQNFEHKTKRPWARDVFSKKNSIEFLKDEDKFCDYKIDRYMSIPEKRTDVNYCIYAYNVAVERIFRHEFDNVNEKLKKKNGLYETCKENNERYRKNFLERVFSV